MSESIDIENIDQSTNVAIGTSNQAVNVTIGSPPGNTRETIKAMWVMLVTDQLERRERQQETDEHRKQVTERLDAIDRQIQAPTEHLGRLDGQVAVLAQRLEKIDERDIVQSGRLDALDAQLRMLSTRTVVALAVGVVAFILAGLLLYSAVF